MVRGKSPKFDIGEKKVKKTLDSHICNQNNTARAPMSKCSILSSHKHVILFLISISNQKIVHSKIQSVNMETSKLGQKTEKEKNNNNIFSLTTQLFQLIHQFV